MLTILGILFLVLLALSLLGGGLGYSRWGPAALSPAGLVLLVLVLLWLFGVLQIGIA